jgi:hypothetical protein
MAEESTNGHGESRLDRMEKLMELLIQDHLAFRDEHRQLLTAQVVLTDRVDKLTQRMDKLAETSQRTDERMAKLAESSQRSDERMDALIAVVDGIVRRQPPQAP